MNANNNGWTAERRAKQAAMIHQWKPWEKSTGAKTEEGKARIRYSARRITCQGLLRRACRLLAFRNRAMKNGWVMPERHSKAFEAFKKENDDWLAHAPMKK